MKRLLLPLLNLFVLYGLLFVTSADALKPKNLSGYPEEFYDPESITTYSVKNSDGTEVKIAKVWVLSLTGTTNEKQETHTLFYVNCTLRLITTNQDMDISSGKALKAPRKQIDHLNRPLTIEELKDRLGVKEANEIEPATREEEIYKVGCAESFWNKIPFFKK